MFTYYLLFIFFYTLLLFGEDIEFVNEFTEPSSTSDFQKEHSFKEEERERFFDQGHQKSITHIKDIYTKPQSDQVRYHDPLTVYVPDIITQPQESAITLEQKQLYEQDKEEEQNVEDSTILLGTMLEYSLEPSLQEQHFNQTVQDVIYDVVKQLELVSVSAREMQQIKKEINIGVTDLKKSTEPFFNDIFFKRVCRKFALSLGKSLAAMFAKHKTRINYSAITSLRKKEIISLKQFIKQQRMKRKNKKDFNNHP